MKSIDQINFSFREAGIEHAQHAVSCFMKQTETETACSTTDQNVFGGALRMYQAFNLAKFAIRTLNTTSLR